jgi:hypothetical protein
MYVLDGEDIWCDGKFGVEDDGAALGCGTLRCGGPIGTKSPRGIVVELAAARGLPQYDSRTVPPGPEGGEDVDRPVIRG